MYPSTATVAIIVLLYNGQLLSGFNVFFKGLKIDGLQASITDVDELHVYARDMLMTFLTLHKN